MITLAHTASDSATMFRRRVLHLRRYPSLTVMLVGQPIVFLLLFVYVFGGTMGEGIAGATGGRAEYLEYIVPALLAIAVASVALGTAISVATDMTEGVVARFRTMDIAPSSVLAGHVLGAVVQTAMALVAVLAVAVLLGFRADASALEWVALAGLLAAVTLALTWATVAIGLASKTVESASNTPTPLVFLPFLGSGFVPTDSMPTGLRWFAEHQPFTPIIETIRGLLTGTAIGNDAAAALAWCVGVTALTAVASVRLYRRVPTH